MTTHYIIPARRNSKEFPFKNRKLISLFPLSFLRQCVVYTDDEVLVDFCEDNNIPVKVRPEEVSTDTCSTKRTIERYVSDYNVDISDILVVLYLTYPERTMTQVDNALDFLRSSTSKSLLCRKECKTTPYLMAYDEGDNRGRQVVKHNLYRKQDYPKVFEISHFISAFQVSELPSLNNNLYNGDTVFYPIEDVIDVDYEEDYEKHKNNC